MEIYRLHVSIRGIDPSIWRRIELSSRTTLKQFHRILQIAMGWEDRHLHEFVAQGKRYRDPDPYDDEQSVAFRENGVRLCKLLPTVGGEVLYIYDLGDYWQHVVRLESISAPNAGAQYPRVADGKRSCPPEDCGGPGSYTELLEILLDPERDEFARRLQWVGTRFDAEEFSAEAVNERLWRNRLL